MERPLSRLFGRNFAPLCWAKSLTGIPDIEDLPSENLQIGTPTIVFF